MDTLKVGQTPTPPPQDLSSTPSTGLTPSTNPLGGTPSVEPQGLDGAPPEVQVLTPTTTPVFTKVSDMHLKEDDLHYGLGMDHRETEVIAKGERYEAISDILQQHDKTGALPVSRYSSSGLAGLIVEHEARLIEGETQAPLTPQSDPRMPGRYHGMAFGGSEPENRTSGLGQNYDQFVLRPGNLREMVGMHPSDQTSRNCQALMLQTVLEGNTVLFHLDDMEDVDAIVSGNKTYKESTSVTSNELIFIKKNWGKEFTGFPTLDMTKSTGPDNIVTEPRSGRFDENSIKFFRHGVEVPSPFGPTED